MNVATLAYSVRQGMIKHKREFDRIFEPLLLQNYMSKDMIHMVTGFDIVKFDADIHCPPDKSCADWITEKYGERAAELVKELLDYPKTEKV